MNKNVFAITFDLFWTFSYTFYNETRNILLDMHVMDYSIAFGWLLQTKGAYKSRVIYNTKVTHVLLFTTNANN